MPASTPHPGGVLFMMHCPSNSGYAIEKLERTFFRAARRSGYAKDRIVFSYPSVEDGRSSWMDASISLLECNFHDPTPPQIGGLLDRLRSRGVDTVFAFDLQPDNRVCRILRRAGIGRLISYWGAPISPRNKGLKLLLKQLEVRLRRAGPDHYVFESEAMRELAISGRGIPPARCSVIPTGVDTELYKPRPELREPKLSQLGIPPDRRVFVYAGHMESRKGVHVIVKAMDHLVGTVGRRDLHFLAVGNRPGEEERFFDLLEDARTDEFISFKGYRDDVPEILAAAYAGVIASTGWDSWPMSVLEMGASGLPLLVSDLQGLKEFVVEGEHGMRFPPGDHVSLARLMSTLADEEGEARRMGLRSREKVVTRYSEEVQLRRLASLLSLQRY